MEDTFQDDTYQDDVYYEPEPRKGISGWLIALIVFIVLAVICCICLFLATVFLPPAVGNTFSTIVETLEAATPIP